MFNPSISLSATSDPSQISITDSSTGSDVLITDRKINVYQANNSLLGASPYDFPLSVGSSIIINPLDKDYGLTIVATWVNNVGTVLYTATAIGAFVQYGLLFAQSLTQTQEANPNIISDQNFMGNKFNLFTEIQSALNAITSGQSVFSAQSCITRYQKLLVNSSYFF